MKVLQINAALEYGSTGRNAIELSEYLEKQGHESYIAYSKCIKPIKNSYKINSIFDVKLHGFLSRLTGLQGYFSVIPTLKLINFMQKEKFDIVNLGNLHGNFINIPILFKYLAKNDIPTVITLHDCFLYTGKCSHYTKDGCFLWKSECDNCPRLKKDNKSWIFDRTRYIFNARKKMYNSIKNLAVIGVSDWITNEAKKSMLSCAKEITRIYNWVDLDVFYPKKTAINKKYNIENKFVILGVASGWSNAKGLDIFYELADVLPDDCHIVLVGRNPEQNICRNITYIDEIHDVFELAQIYNMADVFLNLSYEESFGKVTAEALSCGVPAIVPNTTANPELIGEGCGYVLASFDIDEILNNIDKVRKIGKEKYVLSARKFAVENFDKNKNISDYIKLFKIILKG